jgi:hypothetical protein
VYRFVSSYVDRELKGEIYNRFELANYSRVWSTFGSAMALGSGWRGNAETAEQISEWIEADWQSERVGFTFGDRDATGK